MIAFVFEVIFSSIFSVSIVHVAGFASTKTGTRPYCMTAKGQEIMVNVGMMTSSPGLKPNTPIATSKAAVPEETATPYFLAQNLANLSSNSFTKGPSEEVQPSVMHFRKYTSSLLINSGWLTGIMGVEIEFYRSLLNRGPALFQRPPRPPVLHSHGPVLPTR